MTERFDPRARALRFAVATAGTVIVGTALIVGLLGDRSVGGLLTRRGVDRDAEHRDAGVHTGPDAGRDGAAEGVDAGGSDPASTPGPDDLSATRVALLRRILEESVDSRARARAVISLAAARGDDPDATVRRAIEHALTDPEARVRSAAAQTLARIGDPGSIEPLRAAREAETDPSTRTAMTGALGSLTAE